METPVQDLLQRQHMSLNYSSSASTEPSPYQSVCRPALIETLDMSSTGNSRNCFFGWLMSARDKGYHLSDMLSHRAVPCARRAWRSNVAFVFGPQAA